jgi:hypothetical protein
VQTYENNIIKAQNLFHKMVGACGPKCFRKLFTDAISEHDIYEFYPVVVQAELSAALALSVKAREQDNGLDVYDYLVGSFGLRPKNLVRLQTRPVADIMGKDVGDVEDMLGRLSFTVRDGVVVHHPETCRCVPEEFQGRKRVKIVKDCA